MTRVLLGLLAVWLTLGATTVQASRTHWTYFGQDTRDGYIMEVSVEGAAGSYVDKYSANQNTRWLTPSQGIVRDGGATYEYMSNFGGNTHKIDLDSGGSANTLAGVGNVVRYYPLQNDGTYEYLASLNQSWSLVDIDGAGARTDVTFSSSFGWSNTWGMGNTASPVYGSHLRADASAAINPFLIRYDANGNWYKGDYSGAASGLFAQAAGLSGALEVVPLGRTNPDGYDAVALFANGLALYDWESDSTSPLKFVGSGFDHIVFLSGDGDYDVLGRQTAGNNTYDWLKVDIAGTDPNQGIYKYTALSMGGADDYLADMVPWSPIPEPTVLALVLGGTLLGLRRKH